MPRAISKPLVVVHFVPHRQGQKFWPWFCINVTDNSDAGNEPTKIGTWSKAFWTDPEVEHEQREYEDGANTNAV